MFFKGKLSILVLQNFEYDGKNLTKNEKFDCLLSDSRYPKM